MENNKGKAQARNIVRGLMNKTGFSGKSKPDSLTQYIDRQIKLEKFKNSY